MTALIWTVAALLLIGLGFVLAAMLFYRESPAPVPEDEVYGMCLMWESGDDRI